MRSERFYYDGARRIQELVTDPLATVELLETPEGGANNPELGELLNQTIPGGTTGLDGSANPLNFESGQLENPGPVIGAGGTPLPTSLTGLEREYVWGPGDNGLDEILVQHDVERKPFWMIQDDGGDVVAMCDLQGSGGTARVVKSWQYDAYGQCLRATDVVTATSNYSIPLNRIGHKGLFMDRLDKGLANSTTYADIPRLEPFSTVLYQNRNRTYSPQLGRFIQRDPNESGQLLAMMQSPHAAEGAESGGSMNMQLLYRSGGSLHAALRSSPWSASDPLGLDPYSLPSTSFNTMAQAQIQGMGLTASVGVVAAPSAVASMNAATIIPGLIMGTAGSAKITAFVAAGIAAATVSSGVLVAGDGFRRYMKLKSELALATEAASTRPPNLSPPGAGRNGALNQVLRDNGVPTSMSPTRTGPNLDRQGNLQPGRTYEYDVPRSGGGIRTVIIRDDAAGHNYGPNNAQNRGPHFNDQNGGHYDYGL